MSRNKIVTSIETGLAALEERFKGTDKSSRLYLVWRYLFHSELPEKSRLNAVQILFLISILVGSFYGFFVSPLLSEMVQWAQSMGGGIDLNFQSAGRGRDITLQTTLPAALIKLGVSTHLLGLISTAVICALSFSAWSLASHIFVKCPAFNISLMLFFLHYPFDNFHYYPVFYPFYFFIFGQTGFYLAFLILALFALKQNKLAMALLGLLFIVHLPWGLGMLLSLGGYILLRWEVPGGFKGVGALLLTLTFSFLLFWSCKNYLEGNATEAVRIKTERAELSEYDFESLVNALGPKEATPMGGLRTPQAELKIVRSDHNRLFQQSGKGFFKEAFMYFKNEVWLLILLLVFYFKKKEFFAGRLSELWPYLVGIYAFATAFKVYEEIDPNLVFLNSIHHDLGGLALRTVVNRWMNFGVALLPIASVSLVAYFAFRERKVLALWLLPCCFLSRFMPVFNYSWPGLLAGQIFWLGAILLARDVLGEKKISRAVSSVWGRVFPQAFTGLFLLSFATYFLVKTLVFQPFLFKDEYMGLAKYLQKQEGQILQGPYVVGGQFKASLRSGRAGYYPDYIGLPTFNESKPVVNVYCHITPGLGYGESAQITKDCFEKRDPVVWKYIAKQLEVTHVLVTSDYKLKLPRVMDAGELALYKIN